jgi:hypothetical protein
MKAFIYLMLTLAEDEENQRRGLVAILYQIGSTGSDADPELFREASAAASYIPIRFSGVHFCMDNPVARVLGRLLLAGAGSNFRARHRIHSGI